MSLTTPMVASKRPKVSSGLREEITKDIMVPMDVLIETYTFDYDSIISTIQSSGGKVTQTYKYAKGLAAQIDFTTFTQLKSNPNVKSLSKDELRYLTADDVNLDLAAVNALDEDIRAGNAFNFDSEGYEMTTLGKSSPVFSPNTYANPSTMHADDVWLADDNFGEGSLVVIIDTGIYPDHFMLQGSVIGGVDLSPDVGGPDYGWDLPNNHYHGTHVAGIVAGHGAIIVPNDDLLAESLELHSVSDLPVYDENHKLIPLLGTAPFADLYAIKVFPSGGSGVPESVIINGIEHAIAMHESGDYDVDVISMSLGGGTLFDGRDMEDTVVDYATSIGITVVTSNGNEGPASMTTGSPGTANTAISVGAAAHPINTRVFWDVAQYGSLGIGELLFTSDIPQIYAFSSRGPTSDGRDKPTLSATGMFVFSAVTPLYGDLGWASGTSMACPAVSGAVALLNTHSNNNGLGASPYDYKEALIAGADWLPGYDEFDQGAGYLNIWNSFNSFVSDSSYGDPHPELPPTYSSESVAPKGMELDVSKGPVSFYIQNLAPGHAFHYYFDTPANVKSISLKIKNVDLGYDLGLNSFEVYVQSAMRSSYGYYVETANVWGSANFLIKDMDTSWGGATISGVYSADMPIQTGYTKVVIENDWTSFDAMSGLVTIDVHFDTKRDAPDVSISGEAFDGSSDQYLFPGIFGMAKYKLSWQNDWTRYPASDLDLVMLGLDENFNALWLDVAGATFNSPEMSIHPQMNAALRFGGKPGDLAYVVVWVDGYSVYTPTDDYVLDIWF
jgi:subtilisin family serine protease